MTSLQLLGVLLVSVPVSVLVVTGAVRFVHLTCSDSSMRAVALGLLAVLIGIYLLRDLK